MVAYLKRKRQGRVGFVGIKLDLSKAYDRVDWIFLIAILKRMGFGEQFSNLIGEFITTVDYKILVEGRVIALSSQAGELDRVIPYPLTYSF